MQSDDLLTAWQRHVQRGDHNVAGGDRGWLPTAMRVAHDQLRNRVERRYPAI